MISIKDNLIPRDKLKLCHAWLDKANWVYGWPSNTDMQFGHWNVDIAKTAITNTTEIKDRLPQAFKEVWKDLNNKLYKDKATLIRCYSNRHTFGTEGYIHTDTKRKEDHTIVIYLDDWNANWGGETMFYDPLKTEIIKSVIPSYGKVVSFPGTIPHKAAAISRICSKVRTTLMFKATIDPKAIYEAEELLTEFLKEIGADKKPHKNGSLMDHLIRVFHILKSVGANDILALAGGLHSIYGTNAYKTGCLSYTSWKVEQTFGPEVDRLVKLFSKLDRPNALENPDGSLSELDLFLMRSIECANLYDQGELDAEKYPNLHEFVKIFKKG